MAPSITPLLVNIGLDSRGLRGVVRVMARIARACGLPCTPPVSAHLDAVQVRMEFDFRREAAVMDAIASDLQVCMLPTIRTC